MTPENLRAIRAIHARIVPAMIAGKGWEEAYRQDVGALLAALDDQAADLAALRIEHEAHDATMQRSIDGAAERIAELVADRDRLRDILACERGEKAPEGWVFDRRSASWIRGPYRIKQDGPGSWEVRRGLDQPNDLLFDAVDTALEAIEAANLAAKATP